MGVERRTREVRHLPQGQCLHAWESMNQLVSLASRVPLNRGPTLLSIIEEEAYVGLELLVENLDEFEVAVSQDELHLLREMALNVGVDARVLRLIESLAIAPVHPSRQAAAWPR